jgi:hypothetical protein
VLTTVEFGLNDLKVGLREAGGSVGPPSKVQARDWGNGHINGKSGNVGCCWVAEANGEVSGLAKGLMWDEVGGFK